ncbi:hypothetical protein [Shewanella surugensis]|uniref:Uncharacterized protein n=1 Tax=Shewanella surugensis TaxID=212020 RepID=A0ABT0LEJ8_9GAMM|nr:hypothetical protein [Shewanella surugensis]MCL1126103.1 hypothetical protein [Shewanella surugensis]
MAVDLNKMLTTTQDFQADQLKQFDKFIDNSKDVIASLDSVEKAADKQLSQMEGTLSTLKQAPTSGGTSVPCLALQYDNDYIKLMKKVDIVFEGGQDPQQFCDYIDDRAKQITDAMKKGK